jgi:hypothetical protein
VEKLPFSSNQTRRRLNFVSRTVWKRVPSDLDSSWENVSGAAKAFRSTESILPTWRLVVAHLVIEFLLELFFFIPQIKHSYAMSRNLLAASPLALTSGL